mgnify:CR=1 FL=1
MNTPQEDELKSQVRQLEETVKILRGELDRSVKENQELRHSFEITRDAELDELKSTIQLLRNKLDGNES